MNRSGKIIITLKSDLCISSGYSYAGIIDNDICYDQYGIPYIPSRRLKGCFRETAEKVLYAIVKDKVINAIFGIAGSNKMSALSISNAYVEKYDDIKRMVKANLKASDKEEKRITRQDVLEEFTHVQAQTRLEDGVAVDNTLRYTRVVDHLSPIDKKELKFEAAVTFTGSEENWELVKKIIRGTHNIGLRRNRGNGSVRCEVIDNSDNHNSLNVDTSQLSNVPDEQDCIIRYTIENIDPLMLSSEKDDESETMISGQMILGYFAGRYLDIPGHTPEDEAFQHLFLDDRTIYTNAVPYIDNSAYYPAPLYIRELKKTKKLVNTLVFDDMGQNASDKNTSEANPYSTAGGNLPKKLKGKYLSFDGVGKASKHEVDMRIIYHHSHRGKTGDGKDGLLYTHKVVSENQVFYGEIYTKTQYAKEFEQLFSAVDMSFGKSKTAQYGKCRLIKLTVDKKREDKKSYAAGAKLVVTFMSDAIIHNGMDYTVCGDDVKSCVANRLGIDYIHEYDRKNAEDNIERITGADDIIESTLIYGYQGTWNLRKAPVPAVRAGSCLVYELNKAVEISSDLFVGERNREGYGQIKVNPLIDENGNYIMSDRLENLDNSNGTDNNSEIEKDDILIQNILKKKALDEKVAEAINRGKAILDGLDSSQIGRVTLMLKESMNENESPEKQYEDFEKRVGSIKTEKFKETVEKKVINGLLKQFVNDKRRDEYWGVFLMQILVWNKYQLAIKEKGEKK